MIKEALEYLSNLVHDSRHLEIFQNVHLKRSTFWLRLPDGSVECCETDLPDRKHEVHGLPSLAHAVQRWGDDRTTIFIGGNEVTAILDDAWRRDRVTMPRKYFPPFRLLCCEHRTSFAHRDFVHWLDVDCEAAADIVDKFRLVDFTKVATSASDVKRVGHSLGKSVEEKCGPSGDIIPNEFLLPMVPMLNYPLNSNVVKLRVRVDVDVTNQTFTPFIDAPDAYKYDAELSERIRAFLEGAGLEQTIICGEPEC